MPRTKKPIEDLAEEVKKTSKERNEKETPGRIRLVPTGSSLLNLAISDDVFGGWGVGKIVNLVGDSNSGKTLLALSGLMEVSLDPQWDDYRLIFDDAENSLQMDVESMFGPKLAERIEDPFGNHYGDSDFHSSLTIEDFKNNVWDALKKPSPLIYVLDSYDGVVSRDEIKRQEKESTTKKKQNRDYPRQPAILNQALRQASSKLKHTSSLVQVISQTRDAMNAATFAAQSRRAGGRGLKFFSSHEVWLAILEEIKREVRKKKRGIGWKIRARSHRSKLTGKRRDVDLQVFTEYGVDDIGSMINWLLDNEFWTGSKKAIHSKGFSKKPRSKKEMIAKLEADPKRLYRLKEIVQESWDEIESKLKLNRRKRYE